MAGIMGKIANPEVSVIVPVFDMEETIDRALDSILSQTFSDLEIIVVDDASTDRTATFVSQRASDRLVLIKHSANRGAAAARNTGITASRGRRIAFLDGDDAWNKEKLACQTELIRDLDGASNIAACASGYHLHKGGRSFTFNLNWAPKRFSREIFFGCTISPGSTLLVDRQVFDDIGMFDESLRRLEDWDWLLRFTKKYKMAFVPAPLVDVYVEDGPKKANSEFISEALDCIRSKHMPHLSIVPKMQLQSSILIEKAGMMYRSGRAAHATFYIILALSIYPFRNVAFWRMLWRSIKGLQQRCPWARQSIARDVSFKF